MMAFLLLVALTFQVTGTTQRRDDVTL